VDVGGAENIAREAVGKLGIFHAAADFWREPPDIKGGSRLLELRPHEAAKFPDRGPLLNYSYREHHAAISDILNNARARGSSLTVDDMGEILPHVNPGGFKNNCYECAFALDDILHGVPRVAGPGLAIKASETAPAIIRRAYRLGGATDYLGSRDLQSIGNQISMEKHGTTGMLAWGPAQGNAPGHVLNVVTTSEFPIYLDAQNMMIGTAISPDFFTQKMNFYYFKTGVSSL
jgi:Papain fold toxin 1, glutamine deamidase